MWISLVVGFFWGCSVVPLLYFIRGFFTVFIMFGILCLSFFWFSCQCLPHDWLERLLKCLALSTMLILANWTELHSSDDSCIESRRLSPQTPGRRICIFCLFMLRLSLAVDNIFETYMAWYSLFVLKASLNVNLLTKETKQNIYMMCFPTHILQRCFLSMIRVSILGTYIQGGPTKVKPTYIFVSKILIKFEWIDKIQWFLVNAITVHSHTLGSIKI